jgi:hypothetical protein
MITLPTAQNWLNVKLSFWFHLQISQTFGKSLILKVRHIGRCLNILSKPWLSFKKYHPTTRKGPLSLSTNSNRALPPNIVQVESQLPTEVHTRLTTLENG